MAFVRSQTFTPQPNLEILFVAVDVTRCVVMKAWLVAAPGLRGHANRSQQLRARQVLRVDERYAKERWRAYRLEAEDLPVTVLKRLDEPADA